MHIQILEPPKVIMAKKEGNFRYFAWSTVAKLRDGRIAVAASGNRLWHVCPFGKTVISYSGDNGEHYTQPQAVIDTVLDDRDAGICAFGDHGLLVTSFNNTVAFQRKFLNVGDAAIRADYLNTISPELEKRDKGSHFCFSTDGGKTFGKTYKCPVTSPHGPIELKNGKFLWVGRIHRPDHDYTPVGDYCDAYYITQDGACEFVGRLPEIYEGGEKLTSCEPCAVELEDGTILCHIRVQSDKPNPDGMSASVFTIYQTTSKDGGRTWTQPHRILDVQGGAPSHILRHSSGALVATYGYRGGPYGIKAMFSYDNGRTWDKDNWLYDGARTSDCGYPSSVELEDGSILSVFYATQPDDDACAIWQMKWRFVA